MQCRLSLEEEEQRELWVLEVFRGMEMEKVWQVLETLAFVCVCGVLAKLWWEVNRPFYNNNKTTSSSARTSTLPPGTFGLPILGETIAYMRSMMTSMPTFMAEHKTR